MTGNGGQLMSADAFLLDIWRNVAFQIRAHDEPMPGEWLCGRCPYANVGPICTKCGAPRYEGTALSSLRGRTTETGPTTGSERPE